MDEEERKVRLSLEPSAEEDLLEIWNWNARERSPKHADQYLAFLRECLHRLIDVPTLGQPMVAFPELRVLFMLKRSRGQGHVAAYELDATGGQVTVLRIFHTSQDWQAKL